MQEKDIIDIDKIADFILEKWRKEKKVVLNIAEGLVTVDIDRFIKQPAEGILYDLNRDRMTLLTQLKSVKPEAIDTCRYINDFAAALVIERLMKEIEELKEKEKEMEKESFGSLLKKARVAQKITLRKISEHTGKKISYLSDIEHGRKKPPDIKTVRQIEKLLNIQDGRLEKIASENKNPDVAIAERIG